MLRHVSTGLTTIRKVPNKSITATIVGVHSQSFPNTQLKRVQTQESRAWYVLYFGGMLVWWYAGTTFGRWWGKYLSLNKFNK